MRGVVLFQLSLRLSTVFCSKNEPLSLNGIQQENTDILYKENMARTVWTGFKSFQLPVETL